MINNLVLVGRLTKDVIVNKTNAQQSVTTFQLAVKRTSGKPDANGEMPTDFPSIVAWGKQAENLAKYCRKGSLIGVQGRLQTRTYQDNNKTLYVTEVHADSIQYLESKKKSNNPTENQFEGQGTSYRDDNPFNGNSKMPWDN